MSIELIVIFGLVFCMCVEAGDGVDEGGAREDIVVGE